MGYYDVYRVARAERLAAEKKAAAKVKKAAAKVKKANAQNVKVETSEGLCDCGGDCLLQIRETHTGPVERWACAHT